MGSRKEHMIHCNLDANSLHHEKLFQLIKKRQDINKIVKSKFYCACAEFFPKVLIGEFFGYFAVCFQDILLDHTKFLIRREGVQSRGVCHGGPYVTIENTSLPVDEWKISSWWGYFRIEDNQALDPNQTFDLEKAIRAWADKNKIIKIPLPYEIQTQVVGSSLQIRPVVKFLMDVKNVNPLVLVINDMIKLKERHFKEIAEMTILEQKKRESEFQPEKEILEFHLSENTEKQIFICTNAIEENLGSGNQEANFTQSGF
jgi:hypothetical protein